MNTETPERPFFYREDGQKVYIQAISLLELTKAEEGIKQEYINRGEPVLPPMYTVKTAGSGEIKLPMNETNLVVDGNEVESAKRQMDWNLHISALNKMKAETGAVTTDIILDGVIEEPPLTEAWKERKRKRHIILPEDEDELHKFYKMTEILKTPKDLVTAQGQIMVLSGSGSITQEDVDAAGELFLREIQKLTGGRTGKMGNAEGSGESDPSGGALDAQHLPKRTRRRKAVGHPAEPVGAVQE